MTVLFVGLGVYSREGGMERFNRRVLECLSRNATATAIVLWDDDSAPAPAGLAFSGCRARKLAALRDFVRALLRDRPDVILYGHVLLSPLALVARLLGRRARNVLIAHGYEVWDRPSALRRLTTSWSIDYVASVSDYTAERMAAAYSLRRERFVRVINAVDPGEATDSPARDGLTLLTVSRLDRLDRAKHVDKVIAAMPAVLARFPAARLHVVGDGNLRPELDALVADLGLREQVHLRGLVSDDERDSLYARAAAFVLPSTQEGFGIVYLEAWRYRLPVVAGAGGAAPEVVTDGVTGLVVDPSPPAIAGAIVRLLDDAELARRLGEAGHERLVDSYTAERFEAAFVKMLDRVAGA